MKNTFTKAYLRKNKGCYTLKQINELSFINNKVITLEDIINSEISFEDKLWWLNHNCDFWYYDKVGCYNTVQKVKTILDNWYKKYFSGYTKSFVVFFSDDWLSDPSGFGRLSKANQKTLLKELTNYINKNSK